MSVDAANINIHFDDDAEGKEKVVLTSGGVDSKHEAAPDSAAMLAQLAADEHKQEPETKQGRRFQPKAQTHGFAYHSVRKPPFVTPVIFWRTLKLFRALDAGRSGSVGLDPLIQNLVGTFGDDLGSVQSLNVMREECMRIPEKTGQAVVPVEYFLEILDFVCQTYEGGNIDKKALVDIDRLAGVDEDEAEEEAHFHEENCCQRMWQDHVNKVKHDKMNAKRSGLFDFSRVEARFGASVSSYFYFAQSILYFNFTVGCVFLIILIPGILDYDFTHKTDGFTENSYYGLLFGSGMENSFLFYGYYKDKYFSDTYNMQISYVLVLLFMFIASLSVILRYMNLASGHDEDLDQFKVCREVLTGMDYTLQTKHDMKLQLDQIFRSIRELCQEAVENKEAEKHETHVGANYKLQLRRYCGYFMTLLLIGGSCGIVGFLIVFEDTVIAEQLQSQPEIARYAELIVPSSVSFFRVTSPMLIFAIVAFESYEVADDRFVHTFSRLFMTRMFYVLVILFQTMYVPSGAAPIYCDNAYNDEDVLFCDNAFLQSQFCQSDLNGGDVIDDVAGCIPCTQVDECVTYVCPETAVGVFYYAIIFLDIFIDAGVSLGGGLAKKIARRCLGRGVRDDVASSYSSDDRYKEEFPIPVNIINVMYLQGLIWSGMPYCPALPFLGSISLWCAIFVKRIQVILLCRPSLKPMGVSRQEGYYRSLLIVTLVIAMIPFSFFLREKVSCGPHFDPQLTGGQSPMDVMWEYIDTLPAWVGVVVNYLQNVVLLWVLLIVLAMYGTYLRKSMTSTEGELKYVRDRVKLEMTDLHDIIRKEKIVLDELQEQGRYQFKLWMSSEDMVFFANHYTHLFSQNYFDDMYELIKLTNEETWELLHEWQDERGLRIMDGHVKFFQRKLSEKRRELL